MSAPLILYDKRDYDTTGPWTSLGYGTYGYIGDVGMPNDSISSMVIAPFTKVTLFEDNGFLGANIAFTGPRSIPRLGDLGWEDRVSSLKIVRVEPTDTQKMNCCQGITPAYQCGEYAPGSATCSTATAAYCNASRLGEAYCQSWCKQNPAQCDTAAAAYCEANPSVPFCSCLKSPAAIKNIANPKCVDKTCLESGYLSSAMLATNCPAVVDCSISTALANSGVVLANNTSIQQNCGTTTPVVTTPTVESSETNLSDTYIILMAFMLFVIITLLGVSIMIGSPDSSQSDVTGAYQRMMSSY